MLAVGSMVGRLSVICNGRWHWSNSALQFILQDEDYSVFSEVLTLEVQ